MSKAHDKRITELVTAVTQHGMAVPSGYTFNPRRTPPLFKTVSTVANELLYDVELETDEEREEPES